MTQQYNYTRIYDMGTITKLGYQNPFNSHEHTQTHIYILNVQAKVATHQGEDINDSPESIDVTLIWCYELSFLVLNLFKKE